jgi:hypothetical protein
MKRDRPLTGPLHLIEYVLGWPRLARIVLIAVFALAVTLSLTPLIDYIYSLYFFSTATVIVPSLISAVFGLIMYMIGWWLVVGTVGEKLDARLWTLFYIILGVFAVALVGFLVVRGVSLVSIYTSS